MNSVSHEEDDSNNSVRTSEAEKELGNWIDQFKDEKGEWVKDCNLLMGLMSLYEDKSEKETEENDKNDVEEEEDDLNVFPEDSFRGKLQDFTETVKDYLESRRSTLSAPEGPYRSKKPNFPFYKEFYAYLEGQKFIENMVEVLVKMFSMHPELPADPLEFIRENFGISKKLEDKLIEEWISISEEMLELYEEGKTLEDKIRQYRDRTTLVEAPSGAAIIQEDMKRERLPQKALNDILIALEDRQKDGAFFMWESEEKTPESSETSIILHPVPSDLPLMPTEEEEKEASSTSTSCSPVHVDYKEGEESSTSLDMGSIDS